MEGDKIRIIQPSKEIFSIIEEYKKITKEAVPNSKITLIGSFAVPMCGKEEFDLMVETDNIEEAQEKIAKNERFGRGPIENGEGFCRSKKRYGIICELHILPKGHPKIKKYLSLIKRLRSDKKLREDYARLKMSLDGSSEEDYKKAKREFIEEKNLNQ